jgi:very-short-patch-repair endonuclease
MMSLVFNSRSQKQKHQYLRNHAADAERILWSRLKGRQLLGYKFRRQHGIGVFILDFYCPESKLAIEIDGATHWTEAEREYDRRRKEYIELYSIHFLRFTNSDVYKNLDGVLAAIAEAVKNTFTISKDYSSLAPLSLTLQSSLSKQE